MEIFRSQRVMLWILYFTFVLLLPASAGAQDINVEGITVRSEDYPQIWEYVQQRQSEGSLTIRELMEALPLSACSRQPSPTELQGHWVALPEVNEMFCNAMAESTGRSFEEIANALTDFPSEISVDSDHCIEYTFGGMSAVLDALVCYDEGVYGIRSEACNIVYCLNMLCIQVPYALQDETAFVYLFHVKVPASDEQSASLMLQESSAPVETLFFGSYEQDGNLWNGREPIEWIVAAKRENGTALLISQSILITMGKAKAQEWLPVEFVNLAFNEQEKKALLTQHPMSSLKRGVCFLLTSEEVSVYLDGIDLQSTGTTYAGEAESRWWVNDMDHVMTQCYVDENGDVRLDGFIDIDRNGKHPSAGVRPACWVDLSMVSNTDTALREIAQPYAQPGQVVTFGHYQQNNITMDGAEPIEWIVLDSRNGESLLLSRYVLEQRALGSPTWEDSSLRQWLGGAFMDSAFSPEERATIRTVLVANPRLEEDNAPDTAESVFLLSQEEIERYMPNPDDRLAARSATMASQGTNNWIPQDRPVAWLTRTTGTFRTICTVSDSGGWLIRNHDQENRNDNQFINGIRPAVWIDLHMLTEEMVAASQQNIGADREALFVHTLPEKSCFAIAGQVVTLGATEQSNGSEPLEWLVLDSDGSRSLLLSVKGLQAAKYTNGMFNLGWRGSNIRSLLASMQADIFSQQELTCILDTLLEDDSSEGEPDKLFLLSMEEVEYYLPDEALRVCQAINGRGPCEWWLRTVPADYYNATTIDSAGRLHTSVSVADKNTWVRPALWVDLARIDLLLQDTPEEKAPLPTDEPKTVMLNPFDDY